MLRKFIIPSIYLYVNYLKQFIMIIIYYDGRHRLRVRTVYFARLRNVNSKIKEKGLHSTDDKIFFSRSFLKKLWTFLVKITNS